MTSNLQTRYVVVAFVLALAGLCIYYNWPISLGIDLRGGSILTYRIERLDSDPTSVADMTQVERSREIEDTLAVISQRINKEGVKDISVQREGDEYIVITLPSFGEEQTNEIRRRMTQMGRLEMPIIATPNDTNSEGVKFSPNWDEERKAQKANYTPPVDFRWYPRRPDRGELSEGEYAAALAVYLDKLETAPWELDGDWLFYDPVYWDDDRVKEEPGITGRDIVNPRRGYDDQGGNAVVFDIKESKQSFLASYSGTYLKRQMTMVLNGEVWSSATIQDTLSSNVQISRGSGGYTEEEQKWLLNCLQAGSLKLKPVLESQEQIGATLGAKAIERGKLAFLIGGLVVIFFMVYFYRFAGMLSVIALALNFAMIFGILMLLEASLTLPGLAGLVLTVGMAVDANILIFERIREELAKGKKLIHAAKNGFDRAFITIFDANLTTFIVALFLVWYGQGPIKGFGYTLMAGILCSMFAALYITRTFLGTALARNWVSELKMRRLLEGSKIDFLGKVPIARIVSFVAVIIGVALFVGTGEKKYSLDFNGGTAVRMVFNEPIQDSEVKKTIGQIKDENGKTKYESPEDRMVDPADGKAFDHDIRLDYVAKETEGTAEDGSDPYQAIRTELATAFAGKLATKTLTDPNFDSATGDWTAKLHFHTKPENDDWVRSAVEKAGLTEVVLTPGSEGKVYTVTAKASPEVNNVATRRIIEELQNDIRLEPSSPFGKVRFVGPQVVAQLKESAFQSMFLSLLFILAYIWFRFRELKYGIAAAVALVHDVLIALGVVILVNMLGIVTVPISLDVIAAFLTIIGYSLNDTIIVFDRIRENLGNTQGSYAEIINRSINQTLSRTLLTSITTFIVIAVIFGANIGLETPLQGLSFTLMIGVIVGTYSSIFVASPLLVWMHKREEKKAAASGRPAVQ